MDKSGDNIIQKIDYQGLAKQFIDFYYNKWATNPIDFLTNGCILETTKMNYNNKIIKGKEIIQEMINFHSNGQITFNSINCNALDSGSRRIDIMASGNIIKNGNQYNYSQYFLLLFYDNSWKIQNSILNIFI
jgi:hypothetical protein